MILEREGSAWQIRQQLGAHEILFDGKVTSRGVVLHPLSSVITAPVLARCIETLAEADLGPVHTTLDLPASQHLVDALQAVGFVPGARRITFRRSLLGFVRHPSALFELVPLANHLGEAASVLEAVCRDMPLLRDASAEACLEHLVALAGGRMGEGWTLATRDGRPAGLFVPIVEEERGELLAFGLAEWARGRGWGRSLHLSALGALRHLGAHVYEDGTETGNLPMRALFEASGCRATGAYEDWALGVEPRERVVGWSGGVVPLPDAPFWSDRREESSLSAGPALCAALARVAFAYLLDRAQLVRSEPLWILDVQPGTLVRTVRILSELQRLVAEHPEPLPDWKLVVCGAPPSLSRRWRRDRRLRAWVEAGLLDWIEPPPTHGAQELAISRARIHENGGIFAVVVEVGCYLAQHGYRVDGQEARELRVCPDPEVAAQWRVHTGDDPVDMLPEAMEEYGLDLVFARYRGSGFHDVLVPTGAAAHLDTLLRWGGGPSMVVSVEPGTLCIEEMQGRTLGPLYGEAAPRLPLDHHALRSALETLGFSGRLAEAGDGDTVVAAIAKGEPRDLAHTVRTWRQEFEERCPVVRNWPMADPGVVEELGLTPLLAQLRLSGHDPEVFLALVPRLRELMKALTDMQRRQLLQALERVCFHAAGAPFDSDAAFSAGRMAYDLHDAGLAWRAFHAAAQAGGLTIPTALNLGLAAWAADRPKVARGQFEAVLLLDPGNEAARALLRDLDEALRG